MKTCHYRGHDFKRNTVIKSTYLINTYEYGVAACLELERWFNDPFAKGVELEQATSQNIKTSPRTHHIHRDQQSLRADAGIHIT